MQPQPRSETRPHQDPNISPALTPESQSTMNDAPPDSLAFNPDADDFDGTPEVQLSEPEVQHLVSALKEAAATSIDGAEVGVGTQEDSTYWVLEDMAPLNAESQAAISRLRSFKPPPFPLWNRLPINRRAAVLVLLFADRRGDLRVVLTIRSANMRSFSGHAAFPGGKADAAEESPYEIARREAWEEIGLPMDDTKIPAPFKIELLCYLPHNLARNDLAVRPCVALLHTTAPLDHEPSPLVEETMIPRLHPNEVAAVFTAPFSNFLRMTDREPPPGQVLPPGHWYDGSWISWKDEPWRVHNFYVPINNQRVAKPPPEEREGEEGKIADALDEEEEKVGRYKVWGMTAKVLVDAAIVAYGKRPEMEHNDVIGDEKLILMADEEGRFFDKNKM